MRQPEGDPSAIELCPGYDVNEVKEIGPGLEGWIQTFTLHSVDQCDTFNCHTLDHLNKKFTFRLNGCGFGRCPR